jgi:phosphoglycolate phosphatase
MTNIKYIIFDLDGTLIDSAPSILATFLMVLKKHNIPAKVPLESSLIGAPLDETLAKISGIRNESILQMLKEDFKVTYDNETFKESRIFNGIDQLLCTLHKLKIKLYIATNKRTIPTLLIIKHLGWDKLFDGIISSDTYNLKKLKKNEMIAELIKAKNIDASKCIYVGDTIDDYEAALYNNLEFIFASWGYGATKKNSKAIRAEKVEDIICFVS